MIEVILEHYGGKVPAGTGNRTMLCPFHEDKHKSASVDTEQDLFYCFTCGVGGDAIAIIRWKEGCDYKEAFRISEGITGGGNGALSGRTTGDNGYGLPRRSRNQRSTGRNLPAWMRD